MSRFAEVTGSWRVALRIARRSTQRHRARSTLVLLMLFVPAYAATVLVVSWANLSGTSAQETTFTMGRSDLIVEPEAAGGRAAIDATLPHGSRTLPLVQASTVVHGPTGLRVHPYEATDPTDPLNDGRYVLRAGRHPTASTEVALTQALADELGVGMGDHIEAGLPQRQLTVVGLVDWSRSLRMAGLLVPATTPLSTARVKLLVGLPPGQRDWSPPEGTSVGLMDRAEMGPTAAERAVEAAAALLVVSFTGAQVVLLVGAAFLIGARRQRRELTVVAATGATGRQLSRIVLAGGLLLGASAAAAGAVLGLLTFAAASPAIERVADHPLLDVSVPYWSVAAVATVTLAIGALAALLPARAVRARPVREPSRLDLAVPAAGACLLIAGTAALLAAGNPDGRAELLALGGVAELLGIVACTPTLVRLAGRLAGALPLSGRLALRHAARHRLRTGAAIAAVTAAVAGSVALALAGAARSEAEPAQLAGRPGQVLLSPEATELLGQDGLRQFAAALPARNTVRLHVAVAGVALTMANPSDGAADPTLLAAMEQRNVAVGGAETVRLVTGRDATPHELSTLDGGGAVVFNDQLVQDDHVALTINSGQILSVIAVVAAHRQYFVGLPGLVIAPATAQRLALQVEDRGAVIDTTRPPTGAEIAAANDVLLRTQLTAAEPSASPITARAVDARPPADRTTTMFYLLAAVSAIVTLVAGTVAVGLATVELDGDLAIMTAVGATPRIQGRIRAVQAALIVGTGAFLGLLAGIGPAAGYVGYSVEVSWHTPWPALLLVVLTPPVLATALARLGAARAPNARLTNRPRW